MLLSVIIPVYNEEAVIAATVRDTLDGLNQSGEQFELILVNNGSTDATADILESLCGHVVRVITLHENQTFGGGVIAGMQAARGDYLAVNCADLQVSTAELIRLYRLIRERNAAYCKGDRRLHYRQWHRRFISRAYRLMVNTLFNLRINDVNGYPIILSRQAYELINPQLRSWTIHVELLYKARMHNLTMIEPVVEHGERIGGSSHIDLKAVWIFFSGLLLYRLRTVFQRH